MTCTRCLNWIIIFLTTLIHTRLSDELQKSFPCNSDIYCHGRLLNTIQMAKIYQDSKKFVDMKLRFEPNETLRKFDLFMDEFKNRPTKKQVRDFVESTFEPEGQEFEKWEPTDWQSNPEFLRNIQDDALQQWAYDLNQIWKFLGKKMKPAVKQEQSLYSIIWVPNPVIVPGGRFREFYYWDSYWIIQGLLLSEMFTTVKGVLENFLYVVDKYGHIPNGGRIYYLARSQPPLLIPMVKSYLSITHDRQFIADNLLTMEKEFDYWMRKHTRLITVDDKQYKLGVYGDNSLGPRPESYAEDVESAAAFSSEDKKEAYYSELKAAAESGWDFSSRWFVTNATNKGTLTDTQTRSIIPVDLNAILCWNAALLAEFNGMVGRTDRARYYMDLANSWQKAVEAVLWNEEEGVWLDYDLRNKMKRDFFHPSNIAPLWTGCYNATRTEQIVEDVTRYLQSKNVFYPGGIPTTVEHTGEQWDFPNAWPPLQHMIIVGLKNTGHVGAKKLAFKIAENWVRSNYKAYNKTQVMYEKYDATVPGGHGGGGEYALQEGFGWTNAIIMELLNTYGSRLRIEDAHTPTEKTVPFLGRISSLLYIQVSTALLVLLVSAGFVGVCLYKKRNGSSKEDINTTIDPPSGKTKYAEPDRSRSYRRR